MPLGLSQIGDGYKIGAGSHATPITVTSAFAQFVMSAGKRSVEFYNIGTQDAFYGGSGVTIDNGLPIEFKGQKSWSNLASGWSVYICCSSDETTELRVVEYD